MTKRTALIAALLCCLTTPLPLTAAEQPIEEMERQTQSAPIVQGDEATGDDPAPVTLDTIVVVGKTTSPKGGSSIERSAETIERHSTRNGSLTENLLFTPGVQFAEEDRSSLMGGEILPPEVSISGGKPFQNHFAIDGLANDSLIDPAFKEVNNKNNIPEHSQQLFINPRFLEEYTLYRSNIPARFGGFTGGVVDADTKEPSGAFGGSVYYRTTRSEWTDFHIPGDQKEEFEASPDHKQQPDFKKHDAGLLLDLPLTSNLGVVLGYSTLRSEIPLSHLGGFKNQERRLDNFMLKTVLDLSPESTLTLSGLYTPYESEYFLKNTKDSGYDLEGGAYSLNGSWNRLTPLAEIEIAAGFVESYSNRQAPTDWFNWHSSTPSKDWGTTVDSNFSKEGGYGDMEKNQQTATLATDINFEPFFTGSLEHRPTTGLTLEKSRATFERTETHTSYSVRREEDTKSDAVVCPPGAVDCVPGQQFMYLKNISPAASAEAEIDSYAFYLEDQVNYLRLTMQPGVRLSYNDYIKELNVSPRLGASYDLFGTGNTVVSGGFNRYHGKTFLAHKLYEQLPPLNKWTIEKEDPVDGNPYLGPDNMPYPKTQQTLTTISTTRVSDLKTPYSDEWTIGIDQSLGGGWLNLLYINRHNQDELATTTTKVEGDPSNFNFTEWNNNGESRHEEYSLSWERTWKRQYLSINATYQDTTSSNLNYFERFEEEDLEEWVWYDGEVMLKKELPRKDYNRPWTANLSCSTMLPLGFEFTNHTSYRSGYLARESVDPPPEAPSFVTDAFEENKRHESWIFDWILDWKKGLGGNRELTVSLEVINVFNERVAVDDSDDEFEMGRQFWAGMEYAF